MTTYVRTSSTIDAITFVARARELAKQAGLRAFFEPRVVSDSYAISAWIDASTSFAELISVWPIDELIFPEDIQSFTWLMND